jgi:predicted transcriptional regulator
MRRLLTQKNLNLLIELLDKQEHEAYNELKEYMHLVRKHHCTLYPIHNVGAIVTQRHRVVFDSPNLLPIDSSYHEYEQQY